MTLGIQVEIYKDTDPHVLVDIINARTDPTALREMKNSGAGSFTVSKSDPKILANPSLLDYRNFVRLRINGQVEAGFIIQNKVTKIVGAGEEADEVWEISGEGLRSWLNDARVYPASGLRKTSKETRFFNFASERGSWYDESDWAEPYKIGKYGATNLPGGSWRYAPAYWPDAPNAWWIWNEAATGSGPGTFKHPQGYVYFRNEFTTTEDHACALFFGVDDRAEVYVDGELLMTTADHAWQEVNRLDFDLEAGDHVIAFKAYNYRDTGPGGLIAVLFSYGDPAEPSSAQIINQTGDDTWTCCAYPVVEPGWSAGDVMLTLLEEAEDRGVRFASNITPQFSVSADSNNDPWPDPVSWSFGIGTSYAEVMAAIEELVCDFYLDPDTLNFYAYQNMGYDRSIESTTSDPIILRVGQNLLTASETGQANIINSLLLHTSDGWSEVAPDDSASVTKYGVIENQLSTELSDSAASDLTEELFRQKSLPEKSATFEITPVAGAVPFVDFNVGDWVSAPGEVPGVLEKRRVMSISVTENPDNGVPVYSVEFDTIFKDRQTELEDWVSRTSNSQAISGGFTNSTGLPSSVITPPPGPALGNVPEAPTGLIVSSVGHWGTDGTATSDFGLTWNAVISGSAGAVEVTSYEVWGRLSSNEDMQFLAQVPDTFAYLTGFRPGDEWDFMVRAQSRTGGWGPFSEIETLVAEEPIPDLGTPSAPILRSALGVVNITWDKLLDGQPYPAWYKSMRVERYDDDTSSWIEVADLNYFSANDTDVEVGEEYDYRLVATDVYGNESDPSASSSIVVEGIGYPDLDDEVSGAISSADGKSTNYYQATEPAGGTYKSGDIWFDTDDDYKQYAWDDVAEDWVLVQDSAGAQATADASIATVQTEYAQNTSATEAPVAGWSTTPPEWEAGKYIWTRIRTIKNNATETVSDPVVLAGNEGPAGPAGSDGRGIDSTEIRYQAGSSATVAPTGTWLSSPPATSSGQYLWTRTVISYTSGPATTVYSVAAHGATGSQGVSVTGVTRYYQLASSPPAKPDNSVATPPAPWTTTEPVYTPGETKDLYILDRVTFSDSTRSYSDVSLSSSYAAARAASDKADEAEAKAILAQTTADGKNSVFSGDTEPTIPEEDLAQGDLWLVTDPGDDTEIIGVKVWDGDDWVDNMIVANSILVPGTVGDTLIEDGAITTAKLDANAVTAEKIQAGAIISSKLVVSDFENLLDDPEFAFGAWTTSTTTTTSITDHPISGNGKVLQAVANGTNREAQNRWIGVRPGDQFYAEVWARRTTSASGGTGVYLQLQVQLSTGSVENITVEAVAQGSFTTNVWQSLSGSVTMPDLAYRMRMRLLVSTGVTTGTFQFASPDLRRKNTGQLIVDGAISAGSAIIGEGAIGSAQIGDINADTITSGTLDAGLIAAGSISAVHLAAGSITSSKIGAQVIEAGHIKSKTITANEIAAGTISVDELKPGIGGQIDIADNVTIIAGQDEMAAMRNHFNFGSSGAVVSSPDSEYEFRFNSEGAAIWKVGTKISWWEPTGFHTQAVTIDNQMQLGGLMLSTNSDGDWLLRKV